MQRAAKSWLVFVMMATCASGCYFDASTDSNTTTGTRRADEVAGIMMVQFAQRVAGVTADIVCPTGLSGHAGRTFTCTGTTSDGYTLKIVVLERGEAAFRWDIVESVPVTTTNTEPHDTPGARTDITADVTKTVDSQTGRRCLKNESGYICIED